MLSQDEINDIKKQFSTKEELKDVIDGIIEDFKGYAKDVLDFHSDPDNAYFDCPITGDRIPGSDIFDYVDTTTRRNIYDLFNIDDQDKLDAYDRAMGII
jgi:hypothetical protein